MKKVITFILLLFCIGAYAQLCIPNSNSLGFNGTTGCINITTQNNLNPAAAVTVEAWINASAWGVNRYDNSIFCKHSLSSPTGKSGYALRAGANGTLSFLICGDSAGNGSSFDWVEVYSPPGILTLNTWTHVAATFDGSVVSIYKNGVLLNDTAFIGTIKPSTFPPKIGRYSDNGVAASRFWNGKIDEVRIFNRALSQAEIADSMALHIDPSAQNGMIGYWRLNEGIGSTINDLSTSGNTGTSTGTTWSASVPFNNVPPVPLISFSGVQLSVMNTCPNYQWYLNGGLIPGATGQIYVPAQNGSYSVVDTSAFCESTSLPFVVTTLSVKENDFNSIITLMPNPAADILSIHLSGMSIFNTIDITDIAGRNIFHQSNIKSDLEIPVSGFSKGMYLAKFYGIGAVFTKKFVVE